MNEVPIWEAERQLAPGVPLEHLLPKGDSKMDQRDWELLDKQLSGISLSPPRNGGIIGLAFIAVFLTGTLVGGIVSAHDSKQAQTSREAMAVISFLSGAPPTTRQN